MIAILHESIASERRAAEQLLATLRLDPRELALCRGERAVQAAAVAEILADVAERGDEAVVHWCRKFDDPDFTAEQLRVTWPEMEAAHARVSPALIAAIRQSIAQVREYQAHILPQAPAMLSRSGTELGLRFTPLDSAGCYFPGGRAAYPSSLIMLSVPAQVAGVKRVVVCTPPSRFGKSDLVLAACFELGLTDVYRAGGAAAIAALAFGTQTIPAVDKIVGPGNAYVQLAKRAVAGGVGIDGFLGPSEIVTIADDSAVPEYVAADLLAQAEHDPGSGFVVTPSETLATAIAGEVAAQLRERGRVEAIEKALAQRSAIIVTASLDDAVDWANRFAAEHVNLQTRDDDAVLAKLRHAGAVFVGAYAAVAAGDYVAGPSHCLPTNTTARFSSGISVYEFLKRASVERYTRAGLAHDAAAIEALATAEGLDAHAASVRVRLK
jgi:histidinol dehydrogenase